MYSDQEREATFYKYIRWNFPNAYSHVHLRNLQRHLASHTCEIETNWYQALLRIAPVLANEQHTKEWLAEWTEKMLQLLCDGATTLEDAMSLGKELVEQLNCRTPDALYAFFLAFQKTVVRYLRSEELAVLYPQQALLHAGITYGYIESLQISTQRELAELQKITAQNKEVLQQKEARMQALAAERSTLLSQLRTNDEFQRRRLSSALHDEAIQLGVECVRILRDAIVHPVMELQTQVQAEVALALELCQSLVQELRNFATNLYPASLDNVGIVSAIEELVHEIGERTGLQCTFDYSPLAVHLRLEPKREGLVYWIVREAVLNAVRHAKASYIRVVLFQNEQHLQVKVDDDGLGFVLQSSRDLVRTGHLGLLVLYDRGHELQGNVEVRSSLGQGTSVVLDVPLTIAANIGEDEE